MDEASVLLEVKERVFLNIGRNVVLFQQMDFLLKEMLKQSRVRVEIDGTGAAVPATEASPDSRSLGQVAGAFFEQVLMPEGAPEPLTRASSAGSLAISMHIKTDAARHAAHEAELRQAIVARNELVHGFVAKWKWESVDSLQEAEAYLIEQRVNADKQYLRLKDLYLAQQDARKKAAELLGSDYLQRQAELMASPLVAALCDAAIEYARPDGWTLVSNAGHHIVRCHGDDMLKLWEEHGFSSLSDLIQGFLAFELKTEPCGTGTRQIYRLRSEGCT